MFQKKTAIRSIALATALITTSLCALAQIVEPPRPAQVATRAAIANVVKANATVPAANVKDVDQPARAPFQATVQLSISNFTYTQVPIPAGQRLVIEYVSISGDAASNSGPVQPIALISNAIAGNPSTLYYFSPTPVAALPAQFFYTGSAAIYADALAIGPAYTGYTPSFMNLSVTVSGHLISIP